MTEPTLPFAEALSWAYERRAIIRFFESDDHQATKPTVRVVVIGSNLEDRYQTVHQVAAGQEIEDALAEAITVVKAEYEAKEADLLTSERRRSMLKAVE